MMGRNGREFRIVPRMRLGKLVLFLPDKRAARGMIAFYCPDDKGFGEATNDYYRATNPASKKSDGVAKWFIRHHCGPDVRPTIKSRINQVRLRHV